MSIEERELRIGKVLSRFGAGEPATARVLGAGDTSIPRNGLLPPDAPNIDPSFIRLGALSGSSLAGELQDCRETFLGTCSSKVFSAPALGVSPHSLSESSKSASLAKELFLDTDRDGILEMAHG